MAKPATTDGFTTVTGNPDWLPPADDLKPIKLAIGKTRFELPNLNSTRDFPIDLLPIIVEVKTRYEKSAGLDGEDIGVKLAATIYEWLNATHPRVGLAIRMAKDASPLAMLLSLITTWAEQSSLDPKA